MADPIIRWMAALASGAIGFPLLLLMGFRALLPAEATQYGNLAFWSTVAVGAGVAALAVWFKPVPIWLAVLAGPLAVLALLVPWVAWKVVNAP